MGMWQKKKERVQDKTIVLGIWWKKVDAKNGIKDSKGWL